MDAQRWCAQKSASELLLIANRAGISERRRQTGSCIDIAGIGDGYIIAYNRELRPVAALGAPGAPVDLRPKKSGGSQALTIGALIGGAALAGVVGYLLLADPGSGELQLTIERRP